MKILLALALCAAPSLAAAQTIVPVPPPADDGAVFAAPQSSGAAKSRGPAGAPGKPAALDLTLSSARIRQIIATSGQPRFDGSFSAPGGESAAVPASSMGSFSSSSLTPALKVSDDALPDAPVPAAVRAPAKPQATTLEKSLFWSSWWGYHAAFAADFTTTGMILGRGGYEEDPLYTRFGNKSMTGVIGSAVALHALASVGSYALYREAQKKHGVWRGVLMAAAVGINAVGIEAHVQGTTHNLGVLANWNK